MTLLKQRPAPNPTAVLDEADVQFFRENGFLVIDNIAPLEEIEQLRTIFYRMFAAKIGRKQGAHFDMVGDDDEETVARSPQIINPQFFEPDLLHLQFRANALAIGRQLLGAKARFDFTHVIMKPAGYGAPTPWHQDEAFRRDLPEGYREISIWLPLQPVGSENGCMEFIPKTHLGPVLKHISPSGDKRVHALECAEGFDPHQGTLCPLPLGSATVHHCRTLHHAGPNHSDHERIAYIIGLQIPPEKNPRRFPNFAWNDEKQTANSLRKRAWRRRGGILVEVGRKFANRLQNLFLR